MAIVTESMVTRARKKALQRILARTITAVVILAILAFIACSVALHYWAARFDREATAVIQELSKLRVGGTTKHDAMTRISGLKRTPRSEADGREVYELTIQSPRWVGNLLHEISSKSSGVGYGFAYFYGVRTWSMAARVDFTSGSVSDVAYAIRLSSSDPTEPGSVNINVGSLQSFEEVPVTSESVASPEYRVTNFSQWPEKDATVAFTPGAPHEVLRHAFNINLSCISELRGCSKAEQVLPDAFLDKRVIMKAAGLE
jgi:hypothetical protein